MDASKRANRKSSLSLIKCEGYAHCILLFNSIMYHERMFYNTDEIKTELLKELTALPKISSQKCFKDWKKYWHKCIIPYGDYFERDQINIDECTKIFWVKQKFCIFIIKHHTVFVSYERLCSRTKVLNLLPLTLIYLDWITQNHKN